jgi:hypothetical protein
LAQDKVVADILANPCKILNAGCFAAGTKLWTPLGYRAIETIRAGEKVYSRDQSDPRGLVRENLVEESFVTARAVVMALQQP